VVCTDVLEHVETVEILGTVLTHLRQLARKAVLLVVATRPSNKTLADGRNAHLLQHEEAWWRAQVLAAGFTLSGHAVPHPIRKPSREWAAVVLP
jgi:2-polyprenyl-3-methyl-5-hydroxy-6-metoxy-1,4-benzoquinol methylase